MNATKFKLYFTFVSFLKQNIFICRYIYITKNWTQLKHRCYSAVLLLLCYSTLQIKRNTCYTFVYIYNSCVYQMYLYPVYTKVLGALFWHIMLGFWFIWRRRERENSKWCRPIVLSLILSKQKSSTHSVRKSAFNFQLSLSAANWNRTYWKIETLEKRKPTDIQNVTYVWMRRFIIYWWMKFCAGISKTTKKVWWRKTKRINKFYETEMDELYNQLSYNAETRG